MSGRPGKSRQTWLVFKKVGPSGRVKETQSEAWCEWMKFCIICSPWNQSLSMNIDQTLLLLRVGAWVAARRAWREQERRGYIRVDWQNTKSGGLLTDPVMWHGSRQLLVFDRARVLQQRPTWSGRLDNESGESEHDVSPRPFCVHSISETSHFLWQQNGGPVWSLCWVFLSTLF